MSNYHVKSLFISRGTTLNRLKDQLYSLNMQLLLAMQYHNEDVQAKIQEQMSAVQAEIQQMSSGGGYRNQR